MFNLIFRTSIETMNNLIERKFVVEIDERLAIETILKTEEFEKEEFEKNPKQWLKNYLLESSQEDYAIDDYIYYNDKEDDEEYNKKNDKEKLSIALDYETANNYNLENVVKFLVDNNLHNSIFKWYREELTKHFEPNFLEKLEDAISSIDLEITED